MIDWKQFRDTDYEVSDTGSVRRMTTGRILKPSDDGHGYLKVSLWINKIQYTFKVHALVAECHLPAAVGEVNHIDTDKRNNASSNLEIITHVENMEHAWANGCMHVGSECVIAKLDEELVSEIIFEMIDGRTNSEIAQFYPVVRGTISKIRDRKTWKHVLPGISIPESPNKNEPKLVAAEVREIKRLYAKGYSLSELGRTFEVHSGTVSAIIQGKTWKNIT